jgi:integrase
VLGDFDMDAKQEKSGPLFKEFAEKCLLLPRDWKESTRESYRNYLRIHVYPVFAKIRIIDIKRKALKNFFDDLLIKGSAPATVALVRATINMVMSEAVDSEIIESNPLSDLKLRLKRKRSIDKIPLDEAEAEKLLEQSKVFLNGFYYPPILCLLRTGLRIGELQALKWDDINFAERLIEVKRSWLLIISICYGCPANGEFDNIHERLLKRL